MDIHLISRYFTPLKVAACLLVLWTLLLLSSFYWNQQTATKHIMQQAYAEARANLNKDLTFRRWGSTHGGVYVPVTETQKSIPWLSHVPGRDVVTQDGTALTLLNPASMLRQIMDAYAEEYGIRSRITGLKYLNPTNKPDAWEQQQLESFKRGEQKEIWSINEVNGQPHLRYLRAMYMDPGCDKCHGILGYKEGEFRGATGINLPLVSYFKLIDQSRRNLTTSHGFIWLLGVLGILLSGHAAHRYKQERFRQEHEKEEAAKVLRIYANAFESSGEAILITDRNNRITHINAAFTRLTGYELVDIQGQNPRILASGNTPQQTYQTLWQSLQEEGFWQGELWEKKKSGEVYPKWTAISAVRDDSGEVAFYIASYTDISERKAAEARIAHLAHHDILTGLFNRYSLEDRLAQSLSLAKRNKQQLAVLFIDLDRFKNINDTLGHQIGDQLLIQVAERLKQCVRESDIVARIGGDEFIIVLSDVHDGFKVSVVAEKILLQIAKPYLIDRMELETSPSIGVSVYPEDGDDVETLLKNADVAMYQAKEMGRNNYQFFTPQLLQAAQERLELEHDMRIALDEGQFELYYQPKFHTHDRTLAGFEALIRWNNPHRGFVGPDKFIPIAEETGFIHALGEWVLDEACRQLALWQDPEIEPNVCWPQNVTMAINLSAKQLQSEALFQQVQTTLRKYGLRPEILEFEVTETAAMIDPELAVKQLTALKQLNVSLAIDDFGTGYSSLSYLKRLPIDILKLDRTFVRDIETDRNDAEISMATISLAHNLGLKVVAEGVETEGQYCFLAEHHCDYLQGYLFSRPIASQEAIRYLKIEKVGA